MIHIKRVLFSIAFVSVALAQSSAPPVSDTRIPVHTLLREDIFAGFISGDMEQFARGEKNIELLLAQRPNEKSGLLAWKASATLFRAVLALEEKRNDEFKEKYQQAQDLFVQAVKADPSNVGVSAIQGGTYAVFADRLPAEHRPAAWSKAYDSYKTLWQFQASVVDRMPVHLKGELLAGLAQSAQRTGRSAELQEYLDKMLVVLKDTPYEPIAKRWKANPESAAKGSITCLTCHDGGRLSARMAQLKGQ